MAPKDLRKTFSWYKWHFSSWTVECCSCRAVEQPTLVVPGLQGPGTVRVTEPRLEREAVEASSAKGVHSRDKPRLTPDPKSHFEGMRKTNSNTEKWVHLNALCNIRPINFRKLQLLL